jgi:hypothetical protein
MKAKLTIDQKKLNKIPATIRKEITKELRQKEIRQEIGDIVAETIKDEIAGAPAPLTLKWRERYDSLNKTDEKYGRFKINFTFTGELLRDLARNVKLSTVAQKIVFLFQNSDRKHSKYQGVTKKIGSRSPYSKIAEGLRGHGYDYPKINESAVKMARKFVREKILDKLKKTFRVK